MCFCVRNGYSFFFYLLKFKKKVLCNNHVSLLLLIYAAGWYIFLGVSFSSCVWYSVCELAGGKTFGTFFIIIII